MSMKEIAVPEPVELLLGVDATGKEHRITKTFFDFLGDRIDGYGGAKTPRMLREVMRLLDSLDAQKGDKVVKLDVDKFELLKAAMEWPNESGLSIKYAKQAWKFYEALEAAGIGV